MSLIRKTITVTEEMETFIKGQVQSGDYGNDSEYLRDLLRLERKRQSELAELKSLINAGYESGLSQRKLSDIAAQVEAEYSAQMK